MLSMVEGRRAILLSVEVHPHWTGCILCHHQRRRDGCIIVLIVCFNPRGSRTDCQRKLERRQSFGIGNMSIILQNLDKLFEKLLLCVDVRKLSFGYAIEEWKIACRVLVCSCFSMAGQQLSRQKHRILYLQELQQIRRGTKRSL